ncbi:MAG: hypothetical protein ACLPRE_04135 [Limisphaerales bacterium]
MKWLLKNWWGRLYILVQIVCLVVTIFLAVNFITKSLHDEDDEIGAILNAEKTSRSLGEAPPPPGEQTRFSKEINRVTKERSEERLRIPICYLLSNLAIPVIWSIGLFVCKGLPSRRISQGS